MMQYPASGAACAIAASPGRPSESALFVARGLGPGLPRPGSPRTHDRISELLGSWFAVDVGAAEQVPEHDQRVCEGQVIPTTGSAPNARQLPERRVPWHAGDEGGLVERCRGEAVSCQVHGLTYVDARARRELLGRDDVCSDVAADERLQVERIRHGAGRDRLLSGIGESVPAELLPAGTGVVVDPVLEQGAPVSGDDAVAGIDHEVPEAAQCAGDCLLAGVKGCGDVTLARRGLGEQEITLECPANPRRSSPMSWLRSGSGICLVAGCVRPALMDQPDGVRGEDVELARVGAGNDGRRRRVAHQERPAPAGQGVPDIARVEAIHRTGRRDFEAGAVRRPEQPGTLPGAVGDRELELSKEQFGHFDAEDSTLLTLGALVRDMCAPEHAPGEAELPRTLRDECALRRLFEQVVRGFYRHHLGPLGYAVAAERRPWPAAGDPADLAFLPHLNADVVIRGHRQQVIVECKFAPVFTRHQGKTMIKPDYVRQLVSYASDFRGEFEGATRAVLLGALIQGSTGRDLDVEIDRLPIAVRQVDLSTGPDAIRAALTASLQHLVSASSSTDSAMTRCPTITLG